MNCLAVLPLFKSSLENAQHHNDGKCYKVAYFINIGISKFSKDRRWKGWSKESVRWLKPQDRMSRRWWYRAGQCDCQDWFLNASAWYSEFSVPQLDNNTQLKNLRKKNRKFIVVAELASQEAFLIIPPSKYICYVFCVNNITFIIFASRYH